MLKLLIYEYNLLTNNLITSYLWNAQCMLHMIGGAAAGGSLILKQKFSIKVAKFYYNLPVLYIKAN